MRSICTLIVGLILLSVGCNNNSLVKREYLPLEELKKQNKFLGYEIAIGPGLVEPWAPGDKKEDRKIHPLLNGGQHDDGSPEHTRHWLIQLLQENQYFRLLLVGKDIAPMLLNQ